MPTLCCRRFSQSLEGERFFQYLKNAFDVLYDEGATAPKMMTVGLCVSRIGPAPDLPPMPPPHLG